jgi:hypothetical protein
MGNVQLFNCCKSSWPEMENPVSFCMYTRSGVLLKNGLVEVESSWRCVHADLKGPSPSQSTKMHTHTHITETPQPRYVMLIFRLMSFSVSLQSNSSMLEPTSGTIVTVFSSDSRFVSQLRLLQLHPKYGDPCRNCPFIGRR